jgi:hypothetical protein
MKTLKDYYRIIELYNNYDDQPHRATYSRLCE